MASNALRSAAAVIAFLGDLGERGPVRLEVRAANLAAGMTLARQYDTLRQPGKSRLRDLHAALDKAVIAAYGFTTDEDLLTQLFALNIDLVADPETARGPARSMPRSWLRLRHDPQWPQLLDHLSDQRRHGVPARRVAHDIPCDLP
ncbi:type IIL restriction-modification enzyme MmeI [Pseudonocardia adelaidensis]|uniref:MmeI-like C-terminal domain-containing protein n=1 Tax=Pseudonocardia adelaidensis TaxID=648754 RepID=A0ABP9PB90_9PSEU